MKDTNTNNSITMQDLFNVIMELKSDVGKLSSSLGSLRTEYSIVINEHDCRIKDLEESIKPLTTLKTKVAVIPVVVLFMAGIVKLVLDVLKWVKSSG